MNSISETSAARVAKVTLLSVLTCAVVAWAGGGWEFVRRPVGVVLLAIWFFWWWTTAWYRPLGSTSRYSRRALGMALVLIPGYIVGLVAIPFEYAHFTGPIPRDGAGTNGRWQVFELQLPSLVRSKERKPAHPSPAAAQSLRAGAPPDLLNRKGERPCEPKSPWTSEKARTRSDARPPIKDLDHTP